MKLFSFKLKNHSLGFFLGALDGSSFDSLRKDKISFNQHTNILIGKTFVKKHPKFNKKDTSFFIFGPLKVCFIKNYFLKEIN